MPSAEYFRRQADICLRLSLAASDTEISNRLTMMAEYKLRAAEADTDATSPPVEPRISDTSQSRAGSAVVQQQQQQQQQPSGGAMQERADGQPEEP